jgi:hypothetical protein
MAENLDKANPCREQTRLCLCWGMQEVVKRLSQAGSLEEALRIQMAFVHSQLNVWGRQATDLASLYTKAAEDAAKERTGVMKS